jgi:transcription elongation factor GreB
MSRYRPPAAKSSAYITVEGHDRLTKELKQLWKVERPALTARISAAAANGDRSENGDYIYGRKALREMDRRIRYLSTRLDALTVVDRPPRDTSRVFFGAWVTVEDEQGNESRHRLVGPDEFDSAPGYISIDSPLARAMLKKQVDDEVSVHTPAGEQFLAIIAIEYP